MGGVLEPLHACRQVADGLLERSLTLFQCADAAVEFRVRKLDHRLSLGGCSLDRLVKPIRGPVEFLIEVSKGLGEEIEPFIHAFDCNVKVPTDFSRVRNKQVFQIIVAQSIPILPRGKQNGRPEGRPIVIEKWVALLLVVEIRQ